jgi:hypothetical protein
MQPFMRVGVSARSIFLAGHLESSCRKLFVFPQEPMVFAHSIFPATPIKAMTIWLPYAAYLFIHIISGNGL